MPQDDALILSGPLLSWLTPLAPVLFLLPPSTGSTVPLRHVRSHAVDPTDTLWRWVLVTVRTRRDASGQPSRATPFVDAACFLRRLARAVPRGCAWERHGGRDRGPATRTRPWLLGRRERYPLNGGTEFVTTKSTSRLRQWEQRQRRSTRGASPWPAAIRACRSAWVLRRQLRPESRTATWRAWSVERGVGSSCASGWSSGIGGA